MECIFNRLQQELTIRLHEINNAVDLQRAICDIVRNILQFQNYFEHCSLQTSPDNDSNNSKQQGLKTC
jgi:hypothetical protein